MTSVWRAFARRAAVAAFLLVAATAALSQTIWLQVTPAETEEAAAISSIVEFQLGSELQRQGFLVVTGAPQKADADLSLMVSVGVDGQQIILGARGYELPAGGLILDIEQRASKDLSLYSRLDSLAGAMVADLLNWLQSPSTYVVTPRREVLTRPDRPEEPQPPEKQEQPWPQPAEIRVTLFSRDEGAEIYVGQGQLAGTIQGGKLVIDAPAGAALSVEKRKTGYRADREDFQIGDQPAEIALSPLRRITRFGLELTYTSSQFLGLGAGFRWYPIPDYLMIRVDEYSYFSAGSAFHQDFRVALGSYLFSPPLRRVRLGMASGFGIILSALGGSSSYGDWYWEVADLWLDLNWDRWALFFRAEAKYALGTGKGLLERGFLTGYGPQYTLGWLWKW